MEDVKALIEMSNKVNSPIALYFILLAAFIMIVFRIWKLMPVGLKAYFITALQKKRQVTLFVNAERMRYVVQTIDFNDTEKTKLFRKLLNLKINSICEVSQKVNVSSKDIWREINKNVLDIVEDYKYQFRIFCLTEYHGKGDELADYLLAAFSKYHEENVDFILKSLQAAQESNTFSKKDDIVCYYYSLLNVAMHSGVVDCHLSFTSFNGHITHILND
jgi:hypothetical protein